MSMGCWIAVAIQLDLLIPQLLEVTLRLRPLSKRSRMVFTIPKVHGVAEWSLGDFWKILGSVSWPPEPSVNKSEVFPMLSRPLTWRHDRRLTARPSSCRVWWKGIVRVHFGGIEFKDRFPSNQKLWRFFGNICSPCVRGIFLFVELIKYYWEAMNLSSTSIRTLLGC